MKIYGYTEDLVRGHLNSFRKDLVKLSVFLFLMPSIALSVSLMDLDPDLAKKTRAKVTFMSKMMILRQHFLSSC